MQWPDITTAKILFPSLDDSQTTPSFSISQPVWHILEPNDDNCLKTQLMDLLNRCNGQESLDISTCSATFDDSNGMIFIDLLLLLNLERISLALAILVQMRKFVMLHTFEKTHGFVAMQLLDIVQK